MSELNKSRFNHSPFISGVVVPSNGWRFKSEYIISVDGLEQRATPNGGAWNTRNNDWIEDEQVETIQVIHDSDVAKFRFTGGWRVARDIDYFGKKYPIYCNGEFVWPDELPADKKILPVIAYGYRNKHFPETIHLITAVGKIVDISDPRPGIDALEKYTQGAKYFWNLTGTEVMSPYEVMRAVKQYKKFLAIEDKDFYKKMSELLTELKTKDHQWVGSMNILPTLGTIDEVREKLAISKDPSFQERVAHYKQPLLDSEGYKELLHSARGPIPVDKIPEYTVPLYTLL